MNYSTINDIRNEFLRMKSTNEYNIDKSGVKILEIIGSSFVVGVNEHTIFGEPNNDYIEREIAWYLSMSLNVNDIPGKTPKVWTDVATSNGEINSNYGYLIFSDDCYNQFEHTLQELLDNPYSRRAEMIYTRPSIWVEYNRDGMSDFICTEAVQYFIRNNKLITHVKMRSNDVVFGFRNDLAWQRFVIFILFDCLKEKYNNLEVGHLIWSVGSLHVYERHFHLVTL